MRKIAQKIGEALRDRRPCSISNTTTDGDAVWLHGHKILWREARGGWGFSLCGWPTLTTRSRLRDLFWALDCPVSVFQRDHEQYVSDGAEVQPMPLTGPVLWFPSDGLIRL